MQITVRISEEIMKETLNVDSAEKLTEEQSAFICEYVERALMHRKLNDMQRETFGALDKLNRIIGGENLMDRLLTQTEVLDTLNIKTDHNWIYPKSFKKMFPEAFEISAGQWRLSESDLNRYIESRKHPKEFISTELDLLHASSEYRNADDTDKMWLEGAITIRWHDRKNLVERLAKLILRHPSDFSGEFLFALKKEWDKKNDCPYPAGLYPDIDTISLNIR